MRQREAFQLKGTGIKAFPLPGFRWSILVHGRFVCSVEPEGNIEYAVPVNIDADTALNVLFVADRCVIRDRLIKMQNQN